MAFGSGETVCHSFVFFLCQFIKGFGYSYGKVLLFLFFKNSFHSGRISGRISN